MLAMLGRIEVTTFISSNLALENFIFVSAFLTAYRCFQLMEAKDDALNIFDVLKIIARKFFRLAPAYYGMWAFLYCL
jgi:peptidoglycan/LPS O-acetylase OafA/YrhL